MKLEFSQQIFDKYSSNFMKICPVEAESFRTDGLKDEWTDGQTKITKLIVAFRNFANASKNGIEI